MKEVLDNDAIYKAIYDVVRSIPKGRVTSYGAVAKAIGLKSGARMVGRAMSYAMGVRPVVPVHRVVNSVGLLSGDDGYRKKKLEAEGVEVSNNRIAKYKLLFWNPVQEINV